MKQVVAANGAPAAIGPYSQAIRAGDFLFASGQIPLDPGTGQVVAGGVGEQTRRALDNVKAVVEGAGFTMQQVVKTTVFVSAIENFSVINEIYAEYFREDPPARSFVAVKDLPRGVLIEVEVVAWKG
ncbi:MAG: Rid family detoxifying hydrolase [Synergistaceae bacterium]|jgi:2-iminobutanoate/2-iminopropanoate deaminase|nr:Rid family detoxifying hydrolase [Synergistaceae bacterium]